MNVFISYSHKDRDWCDRLASQLMGLDGDVVTDIWYDPRIAPGSDYDAEILKRLENSDIIIVLISESFLGARFAPFEVKRALELKEQNQCVIVPVLLRHCVYKKLNLGTIDTSPHGRGPIDSDDWTDKALALKTVAQEVEAVTRARRGMAPRRSPLTVNIPKMAKLLHMHCDRGEQHTALYAALAPELIRKHKPFVVVLLGHHLDCPDRFLERLTDIVLKRHLPDPIQQLSPLEWPDTAWSDDPFATFGASLTQSLVTSPYASAEQMNKGLCLLNAVNVLPTWVSADSWDQDMEKLFLIYLKLWNSWPRLPRDRYLVPVVVILYRNGDQVNPRILRFLEGLDRNFYTNLEFVPLPELKKVRPWDMERWLTLPQVKEALPDPDRAFAQVARLPQVPQRIYDLANTYLPAFFGGL